MDGISEKINFLLSELKEKSARELRLARWNHWSNVGAMVLTLLTTGVAVTYGMLPNHSSQLTAELAIVPGGIALLASSLKLGSRSNWHSRQYVGLTSLIRMVKVELPEQPTQEEITAVSHAIRNLEMDTQSIWEKDLSLNWERFEKKELT
jgi:hypothetical protein